MMHAKENKRAPRTLKLSEIERQQEQHKQQKKEQQAAKKAADKQRQGRGKLGRQARSWRGRGRG